MKLLIRIRINSLISTDYKCETTGMVYANSQLKAKISIYTGKKTGIMGRMEGQRLWEPIKGSG